jgi:hypothetical protein
MDAVREVAQVLESVLQMVLGRAQELGGAVRVVGVAAADHLGA